MPSVRPMTAREQRRAKKCDRGDSTDGVTAKPGSAVAAPHTARTAPAPHRRSKEITGKVTAAGNPRTRRAGDWLSSSPSSGGR